LEKSQAAEQVRLILQAERWMEINRLLHRLQARDASAIWTLSLSKATEILAAHLPRWQGVLFLRMVKISSIGIARSKANAAWRRSKSSSKAAR
jgi:uncharacterized alpha-E superfamily protein